MTYEIQFSRQFAAALQRISPGDAEAIRAHLGRKHFVADPAACGTETGQSGIYAQWHKGWRIAYTVDPRSMTAHMLTLTPLLGRRP